MFENRKHYGIAADAWPACLDSASDRMFSRQGLQNSFQQISFNLFKKKNPKTKHTKAYGRPQNKASFLMSDCGNLCSPFGIKRAFIEIQNTLSIPYMGYHTTKKYPVWSTASSSGLPSSRKMRSYWRESSAGLRG